MSKWAIFTDPTPGQEDVPGNCTWGPSTSPPWGSGWKHPSLWPAGLRDDLPDDWRPTPAAPPKSERIAALFAVYDGERLQLERQRADAIDYQDEAWAADVRSQIDALDDEYMNIVGVIMNE